MPSLRFAVDTVKRIKPGCSITLSSSILDDIGPARLTPDATWSPAERVLENVIGSSYEFQIVESPDSRNVEIHRLSCPLDDGRRTYVSPDRRHHYNFDGQFFSPKESSR